MSLWVDYREGSHQLVKPLRKLGLPVEETTLEWGDLAFEGNGPGGATVTIGVEYKQLSELVQSLRTKRLQGKQLPGMRAIYDYSWLLVEGSVDFDARGQLLRRAGRSQFKPMGGSMGITEFYKTMFGLHLRGGITPWNTRSKEETYRWLEALYRSWTDTAWDAHKSHLGLYVAPALVPMSDERTAMAAWPDVGQKISGAVERQFKGSITKACAASVEEWADITTTDENGKSRRIGTKAAERIVAFLHGKRKAA